MAISHVGAYNYAQLSTGLRIQSAADDPAGLAISEKMRAQIRGEDVAARNMRDTQSLINTAEGGLHAATSVVQRMRELAVQANSAILTDSDRAIIQNEFSQLRDTLNAIGEHTEFNTQRLLDGSLTNHRTTTNASGDNVSLDIDAALASHLGDVENNQTIAHIDLRTNPQSALQIIDKALEQLSSSRSSLGAMHNRLDHAVSVSNTTHLNTTAAESRIRDADMAEAKMELDRKLLLQQLYLSTQRMEHQTAGFILNLFA